MENCVDLSFGISNIPKKGSSEYEDLENKLGDKFRKVYALLDEDEHAICGNMDYKYDATLLLNHLQIVEQAVESGSPSYTYCDKIPVANVNYGMIKDLSKNLDMLDISYNISKYGPHVDASDANSVNYYNKVDTDYKNGELVSQVVSHVEEDGSVYPGDETFTFTGSDCKYMLSHIKETVDSQLHNTELFVSKDDIQIQSEKSDDGLSLG